MQDILLDLDQKLINFISISKNGAAIHEANNIRSIISGYVKLQINDSIKVTKLSKRVVDLFRRYKMSIYEPKLDIHHMTSELANQTKEIKENTSIRLYPSDKELLIANFGSIQGAIDALVKELKG